MMRHLFVTVVALAGMVSALPALGRETVPAPPRDKVEIIYAGKLLTMADKTPRSNQTIVVRNGRIAQILPGFMKPSQITDADVSVVDLKDQTVLPGLMDMHVHLSFESGKEPFKLPNVSDEFDADTAPQRDDVTHLVDGIENARRTLLAGFTTVRNLGSEGWHIAVLEEAIKEGRLVGPRIYNAFSPIYAGSDSGQGACTSVESCRRTTRRQIDMGADLIKIYATCSGGKPCGRQDAPSVFLDDELAAIVEVAHSRQLRVAAHAHGEQGIISALKAGVNSIEHGSYNTKESHALFIKNGAFLVPTMAVHDNIEKDILTAKGPMKAVMQNFLDKHGPRMMAAYRDGVMIAMGSDAGVSIHGNNAHELEYYVAEGMPAFDAIKAATVNGAALIGRSADLGTIEVGKIADIIAVKGDPLADISVLKAVDFVMKDGIVFKSVDEGS